MVNFNCNLEDYHTIHYSNEFPSFQEAVEHCVKESKECAKKEYGVVTLIINDWSEIEQLPDYITTYKANGKIYKDWCFELECTEEYETITEIKHNVDWTKSLGLESNCRLHFQYIKETTCKDVNVIKEYYNNLKNKLKNKPYSVGFKYLNPSYNPQYYPLGRLLL